VPRQASTQAQVNATALAKTLKQFGSPFAEWRTAETAAEIAKAISHLCVDREIATARHSMRRASGPSPCRMSRDVTFLRQAALLLPSAFLLAVLFFLLTHGRQDPGFGTYAFLQEWSEGHMVAKSPEGRFVEQAAVFFLPAYVTTLLLVLFVLLAERGLFGPPPKRPESVYRRTFSGTFAVLFLAATVPLVVLGEKLSARLAPGALVAPILVALAPFGAVLVALAPAAILAGPLAWLSKMKPA